MSKSGVYLSMVRGDTFQFDVFVVDPVTGDPYDVSNSHFWFTAKKRYFDADAAALISKESGQGITVLDASAGKARIIIDPSDTDSLTRREVLRFDVQWKDDNDFIHTIVNGDLLVELDVTRKTS